MAGKTFLIIDANSAIHRAFHALPELTDKTGQPAQAVYGFALAFLHIAKELNPDYVAACFDTKKPTFRHKDFAEYKAQRPATPASLVGQFSKVKELLESFGVPVFSLEGYEADDLIATVANKAVGKVALVASGRQSEICVLTGDYDSLQLVNKAVRVYLVTRGVKNAVIYDSLAVFKKFGVHPSQIAAFKALAGDASDNIPGAPGIGEKTAVKLLQHYGGISQIYGGLERQPDGFLPGGKTKAAKIKKTLLKNKEKVLLFERLAKLDANVPIDFSLEKCRFNHLQGDAPRLALEHLGFASLVKRLPRETAYCNNGTLF